MSSNLARYRSSLKLVRQVARDRGSSQTNPLGGTEVCCAGSVGLPSHHFHRGREAHGGADGREHDQVLDPDKNNPFLRQRAFFIPSLGLGHHSRIQTEANRRRREPIKRRIHSYRKPR